MNKVGLYKFDEKKMNELISKGFKQFSMDQKLKKAKSVFIKPNLVTDVKEYIDNGANTDVRVIEAVLKYLSKFEKLKIYLGESSSGTKMKGRNLKNALKYMGVYKLQQKYNFEIVDLYYRSDKIKIPMKYCSNIEKIELNKLLFDVDYIINIPKIKTHKWAVMTSALKNMFGVIPDPLRVRYHRYLDEVISNINYLFYKKIFVLVDGIRAMEGNGPMFGRPIDLNVILFSDDCLCSDIVVSKIMGLDHKKIPHVSRFKRITNFKDKIAVVGDYDLNNFTHRFITAKQNLFLKIEKHLMYHDFIIKIVFSDWFRKNITYRFRNVLKKMRGGSTYWYVKSADGE